MLPCFLVLISSNRFRGGASTTPYSAFDIYDDNKLIINDINLVIQRNDEISTTAFNKDRIGTFNEIIVEPRLNSDPNNDLISLEFKLTNNLTYIGPFNATIVFKKPIAAYKSNPDLNIKLIGVYDAISVGDYALFGSSYSSTYLDDLSGKFSPKSPTVSNTNIYFVWKEISLTKYQETTIAVYLTPSSTIEPAPKLELKMKLEDPNNNRVRFYGTLTGYKQGQEVVIFIVATNMKYETFRYSIIEPNVPIYVEFPYTIQPEMIALIAASLEGFRSEAIDLTTLAQISLQVTRPPEKSYMQDTSMLIGISTEQIMLKDYDPILVLEFDDEHAIFYPLPEVKENGKFSSDILISLITTKVENRKRSFDQIPVGKYNVSIYIHLDHTYFYTKKLYYPIEIKPITMRQPAIRFVEPSFSINFNQNSRPLFIYKAPSVGSENSIYIICKGQTVKVHTFKSDGLTHKIGLNPEWHNFFNLNHDVDSHEKMKFFIQDNNGLISNCEESEIEFTFHPLFDKIIAQNMQTNEQKNMKYIYYKPSENLNVNIIVYTMRHADISIFYKYDDQTFSLPKVYRINKTTKMANIVFEIPNLSGRKNIEVWYEMYGQRKDSDTFEAVPINQASVSLKDKEYVDINEVCEYEIQLPVDDITSIVLEYSDYPASQPFNVNVENGHHEVVLRHQIADDGLFILLGGSEGYQEYDYTIFIDSQMTILFHLYSHDDIVADCSITIKLGAVSEPTLDLVSPPPTFNYYEPLELEIKVFDTSGEFYVDVFYSIDGAKPKQALRITTTEFKTSIDPINKIITTEKFKGDFNGQHTIEIYAMHMNGASSPTVSHNFSFIKEAVLEIVPEIPTTILGGETIEIHAGIRGYPPQNEAPKFGLLFAGVEDRGIPVSDSKWNPRNQDDLIIIDTKIMVPEVYRTSKYIIVAFGVQGKRVAFQIQKQVQLCLKPQIYERTLTLEQNPITYFADVFFNQGIAKLVHSYDPSLLTIDRADVHNNNDRLRIFDTIDRNHIPWIGHIRYYYRYFNDVASITDYFDFDVVDPHKPEITIEMLSEGSNFSYYQNRVDFKITVYDYHIDVTDIVAVKVNGAEPINIKNIKSQRKWVSFIYSYEFPKEDKDYELRFGVYGDMYEYIEDPDNAIQFKVKRTKQIIMLNKIEDQYPYQTNVTINLHVVDFDPDEEIEIKFYNNSDTLFSKKYITRSNYSTDLISFTFTTPNNSGVFVYHFIAESSSERTNPLDISFRSNQPPKAEFYGFNNGTIYDKTEQIMVDGWLFDDSNGTYFVQIDENKAMNLSNYQATQRSYFEIGFNVTNEGIHYFRFYLQDEYGAKSNQLFGNFIISNSTKIEFRSSTHFGKTVHANEEKNFIAIIHVHVEYEKIKILLKFEGQDLPINIYTMVPSNFTEQIKVPLPIDKVNFSAKVEAWAEVYTNSSDGIIKSAIETFEINQIVSPGINFAFPTAGILEIGDAPLDIETFIYDYPPGTEVSIGYYIGKENDPMPSIEDRHNNAGSYIVGSNWKTDIFTTQFTLSEFGELDYVHPFVFLLDSGKFVQFQKFRINTKNKPQILELKDIQPNYCKNSYIEVELVIKDEVTVSLMAAFDSLAFNEIARVSPNNKNTVIKAIIPVDESLNTGQHTLKLKLKDDYNAESNVESKTFSIVADQPPSFKVQIPKLLYNFDEEIEFLGSIQDLSNALNVTVKVLINSGDEQTILNEKSNNDIHLISYKINNPHKSTVLNVVFKASNSNNFAPKPIEFQIRIQQDREIVLLSEIPEMNEPGSTLKLHCYVRGFKPDSELTIFAIIDHEIIKLKEKVIVDSDYKTTKFTCDLKIPNKGGYTNVAIYAESTSNKIKSKYMNLNLFTDIPPKIDEFLDNYIKVNKNAYAPIKFKARTYLPARLCAQNSEGTILYSDEYKDATPNEETIYYMQFVLEGEFEIFLEDKYGIRSEPVYLTIDLERFTEYPLITNVLAVILDSSTIEFVIDYFGDILDDQYLWINVDGNLVTQEASRTVKFDDISNGFHTFAFAGTNRYTRNSGHSKPYYFTIDFQYTQWLKIDAIKKYYAKDEDIILHYLIINKIDQTVIINYEYDDGTSGSIEVEKISDNITIPHSIKRMKQYIKLYINEDSYQYVYIDTNLPPTLEYYYDSEDSDIYISPNTINFNLSVWDDNLVTIYYKIDNDGLAIPIPNSQIYCNGQTLNKIVTLDLDLPFVDGEKEADLIIFAQDNNEQISKIIQKKGTFRNGTASKQPIINYIEIDTEKIYNWGEKIKVTVIINNLKLSTMHHLYYGFDNGPSNLCKQFISKTKNDQSVGFEIQAPCKDGDFDLYLQAVAKEVGNPYSKVIKKRIHVEKRPTIIFEEDLKDVYLRLQDLTLNVTLLGFDPGTYTFTIASRSSTSATVYVDDSYTASFSIKMLKLYLGYHKVTFTVYSGDKVIKQFDKTVLIRNPPIFIIHNEIREQYFKNDYGDIYFSIKSDGIVDIVYEILGEKYYIEKQLNVGGMNITKYDQIFVKETNLDETDVIIYAIDEYGYKSEIYKYKFSSIGQQGAPIMFAYMDVNESIFMPNQSVNIKVFPNGNTDITIICRYEYDTVQILEKFTQVRGVKEFQTNITIPNKYDTVDFYIMAIGNYGVTSAYYHKKVTLLKNPTILIDKLKPSYKPNERFKVHGYIANIEPGANIDLQVETKRSNSIKGVKESIFYNSFTINEQKFAEFEFEHEITDVSNDNYLKITASQNGNRVAQVITDQIKIKPELTVLSDIPRSLQTQSVVHIDVKVKGNSKVQIRCAYSIYNGEKMETKNLTDWIESNNEDVYLRGLDITPTDLLKPYVEIYAVDDSNAESDRSKFSINMDTKHAPVPIFWLDDEEIVLTDNILNVELSYIWQSPGQSISFFYNINKTGDILIKSIENPEMEIKFEFSLPLESGYHDVAIYAYDDTEKAYSIPRHRIVYVSSESTIYMKPILITTSSNPLFTVDRDTLIRFGPDKTIKDIFLNAPPHHFDAEFEYKYNGNTQIITFIDTTIAALIYDNKISPTDDFAIIMKDEKAYVQPCIVNEPPYFKLAKPIPNKFFANGYIDVNFYISHFKNATIVYKIDDSDYKLASEVITTNYTSKPYYTQIPIPGDLSFEFHTIKFVAIDGYHYCSDNITSKFLYYNSHPPTIEINSENLKFLSNETVIITGKIDDLDPEDDLEIFISTDDGNEFHSVYNCSADKRPGCHDFATNLTSYSVLGDNSVLFQVRDSQGANSKNSLVKYWMEKGNTKDKDPDTKPKSKGFLDTIFGKYILWPLIALVVIIIVVVVVVVVIYKKKKNQNNENENAELESMESNEDPNPGLTRDNPMTTEQPADNLTNEP